MVRLFGFDLVICKSGTSKNNVISINLSNKSKIRSCSRFVVNVRSLFCFINTQGKIDI